MKFKENIPMDVSDGQAPSISAEQQVQQEPSEPGVVYSPLTGKVIPLQQVPDDAFACKVLGDGIAVEPTEGRLTAPFDGKVDNVFDTKHAIGLVSDDGMEVLQHVGIDTVSLGGACFTAHVKDGDTVRKGDLLLEFDIEGIKKKGLQTITPVLITNMVGGRPSWISCPPGKTLGGVGGSRACQADRLRLLSVPSVHRLLSPIQRGFEAAGGNEHPMPARIHQLAANIPQWRRSTAERSWPCVL